MDHVKKSFIGLVAGVNGGIATVYVGQPLDTIKVKMQAFPEVYSDAWKCFKITLTKDGIARGLYAGTVPALVANVAENSVLFCALPPSQHIVGRICGKNPGDHLSDFQHACAGSLAAFWSSLTLCPTELVKCKVQSMREMAELGQMKLNPSEIGPWAVTKTIFREQGLFGFTRGLSATFAREMPGYFFFFGGYEACRSIMAGRHDQKKNLGTAATAVCGGVGGCLLWTAIFPFDVIKSRMQIGHIEAAPVPVSGAPPTAHPAPTSSTPSVTTAGPSGTVGSTNSPNMFKLLVRVARHEGIGALYRGLGPTLLRTFPASGALFVAVEWTRKVGHWLLD
ncbi:Mitochondrial ornithine transporter [Paragonimus heterotremus]|uniref:Mitochondrial ornithine transporter n=1 Tax=Paragonimus heterotremus TaxID=100268 RepID=A0A8J4WHW0_9TREM|nr:Mitochondrial ornithine transporter [Paragonimus heterotremus]